MKPSIRWPLLIAGLLTLHAAGMVTFAVIASSDPSHAVEKDYYRKALHWDDKRAQDAANAALGWRAAVSAHPGAQPGQAAVSLTLVDRDGRPVTGAAVHLATFHMARGNEILEADLQETAPGVYTASLPMHRDGKWELRLRARRNGHLFTAILKRYLVVTP
jgi:nitrogen fixation protein FixH